jgi:hypothetical protein
MQPQPYSGWSLFVNSLVAIGTIGAVIVALFGNWIRLRFFPPKLSIGLLDTEGEKVPVTNPAGHVVDEARYYHLLVSNSRRWFPAKNVDVRLLQLEEPAPGGGWRIASGAIAPMMCRNQAFNPMKHDIGSDMDFDICSVRKSGKVLLHPIFAPNNLQTVWNGACDLILSFQARSTEVDTRMVRIRISWDGKWQDGTKEMQDHFKIREEKSHTPT